MPFAACEDKLGATNSRPGVCAVHLRLTRIRMSMYHPAKHEVRFHQSRLARLHLLAGAERSATADGNDLPLEEIAQRRGMSRKTVSPRAQLFCCTRRANASPTIALFRRRIGRQRRASVRRWWLAARAAVIRSSRGEVYRALTDADDGALRRRRLRLR